MRHPRPIRYLQIGGGVIAIVAFLTALFGEFTQRPLLANIAYAIAVVSGTAVVLPQLFAKSRSNPRN